MITGWASSRRPALLEENPFSRFKLPKKTEHLYEYWSLKEEDQFLDWVEAGAYYKKKTTRYSYKKGKS